MNRFQRIMTIVLFWSLSLTSWARESPIENLLLTSGANGGWQNFTNLNTVAVSNVYVSGGLFLGGTNIESVISNFVSDTSGSNAWVWVQANSNGVAYLFSKSNDWNQASTWVSANSNGVAYLFSKSNDWNQASTWVSANSNGVAYLFSKSNDWNQASTWILANSNGVAYLFSKSNDWNQAAIDAADWIARRASVITNRYDGDFAISSNLTVTGTGTFGKVEMAGGVVTNAGIISTSNLFVNGVPVTGAGSQTPVTNDMDFVGYSITNVNVLSASNILVSGTGTVSSLNISGGTLTNGGSVFVTNLWITGGKIAVGTNVATALVTIQSETTGGGAGGQEMLRVARMGQSRALRLKNYDGTTGIAGFVLEGSSFDTALTNWWTFMSFNMNQRLGLFTNMPAASFDVNGYSIFRSNVTAMAALTVSNNLTVTGTGTFSTVSLSGGVITNVGSMSVSNLAVNGTNIQFQTITNVPANGASLQAVVGAGFTNYQWVLPSTDAGSTPIEWQVVASNVFSTATNYYVINITNVAAAVGYLPNAATNKSWDITFEVAWNDGTNSWSFATNGLCVVNLSTNPAFTLITNGTTTAIFHKRINTAFWTGVTLSNQ